MPFYIVKQAGVEGQRLVEADKPAGALNHVIGDSFTATKVDGRELIDAAEAAKDTEYGVEIAGVTKPAENGSEPAGSEGEPSGDHTGEAGDNNEA